MGWCSNWWWFVYWDFASCKSIAVSVLQLMLCVFIKCYPHCLAFIAIYFTFLFLFIAARVKKEHVASLILCAHLLRKSLIPWKSHASIREVEYTHILIIIAFQRWSLLWSKSFADSLKNKSYWCLIVYGMNFDFYFSPKEHLQKLLFFKRAKKSWKSFSSRH